MNTFFLIPLLIMALSVPLILGKVPPNRFFGFRMSSTLESPSAWYPANRAAGWLLLAVGGFSLSFNLAVRWMFPDWSPNRVASWMGLGLGIPLLAGLVGYGISLGRR